MLCKDVLEKFHKLVPFPITPEKIAAAGYDVDQYFKDMGEALRQCDDVDSHPRAKRMCKLLGREAPTSNGLKPVQKGAK